MKLTSLDANRNEELEEDMKIFEKALDDDTRKRFFEFLVEEKVIKAPCLYDFYTKEDWNHKTTNAKKLIKKFQIKDICHDDG